MKALGKLLDRVRRLTRPFGNTLRGAVGLRSVSEQDAKLPPWGDLIARDADLWRESLRRAGSGPRVLIANIVAGFYHNTILESTLAAALTLRGAQVHVLQCDRVLPACMKLKYNRTTPERLVAGGFRRQVCDSCVRLGSGFTSLEGLRVHRFSDLLGPEDASAVEQRSRSLAPTDIPTLREDGLALGEHAYAGCLRYFSTGNLDGQRSSDGVLRRYLEAAVLTSRVVDRLLRSERFDVACFHHGIYIPQGVVSEVCRARDVRIVTWNVAYRKRCFIFSHDDTYHHTLLEEPMSAWKDMVYTDRHDDEIRAYLQSRWKGSQDWIYFHDTPDDRLETLVRETGIDPRKPTIGLLTNVMWDAQLHYKANAFPDMLDWIFKTIQWFAGHPDLQLLIRVHPAELRGVQKSRQFVVDEVRRRFPRTPPNVFLIGPESQVNTYAAMRTCNAVIIYGTKMGVELASMGIPVIVAGEAWIRNKGLTKDVSSQAEYLAILERLPLAESRLPEEKAREARKYAYHFFLRRMIPLASIEPVDDVAHYRLSVESLRDLLPGRDEGLDVICNGILQGTPFIYRSEEKNAHGTP